jgi:UDP-N-acetylglucosamine 2-epimerase (non-hydrolysing)
VTSTYSLMVVIEILACLLPDTTLLRLGGWHLDASKHQIMNHILHVVGARPNFMKIAPIMREMAKYPQHFKSILVHTGQHYDANMSQVFFDELELPSPDVNLGVGSGSHAQQTAQVMLCFEPVVLDYKPDWVIVVGDVNSTLASALVCRKLGIQVAHVEAGLRSFDRTMPEEINRLLTDQLADLLFTPSPDANKNLLREGIAPEKIHLVGNVMIDTLVGLLPKAEQRWPGLCERFGLNRYVLVTLHRPSNVDDSDTLTEIFAALTEISQEIPVLFPVHPRTRRRITDSDLQPGPCNLRLIEPLGYLDFLALQAHADLVLTDSGGVQEETTYLGVPCLTARSNTERPITVTAGTNRLVEGKREALIAAARAALDGGSKRGAVPELWDGMAAQRIVRAVARSDSLCTEKRHQLP